MNQAIVTEVADWLLADYLDPLRLSDFICTPWHAARIEADCIGHGVHDKAEICRIGTAALNQATERLAKLGRKLPP